MMDWYLFVKIIHIITSTILFGTGIGIAFFMWWANKTGDLAAKTYAAKTTVIADLIFTTPSVIIQPISGIILIKIMGYDFDELWLVLTYIGYSISVICWLPVIGIQIRLRNLALKAYANNEELPAEYYKLFKCWFLLGWPAFISLTTIFILMVTKPV